MTSKSRETTFVFQTDFSAAAEMRWEVDLGTIPHPVRRVDVKSYTIHWDNADASNMIGIFTSNLLARDLGIVCNRYNTDALSIKLEQPIEIQGRYKFSIEEQTPSGDFFARTISTASDDGDFAFILVFKEQP